MKYVCILCVCVYVCVRCKHAAVKTPRYACMVDAYQCHYFVLFPFFHQVKNLVVTRLCPGFIADSAPLQVNNKEEGESRTTLLRLNGLSVGRGEVWIKTDPRDAQSLGYDINIHVSLLAKYYIIIWLWRFFEWCI